ncbi:MAG: adenylyltransferase, partial [Oceanospirillaceae bacterium]|nr:adenylyltransferase [Oceanospirillaceae bacterium]
MSNLNAPHGGELVNLIVSESQAQALKSEAGNYKSWDLSHRQLCDIELLLNGGFSPLNGFMSQADYQSVLDKMRLADGTLWPMPITLDVSDEFAAKLTVGEKVTLRDPEGVVVAILELSDKWTPNKQEEAEKVYGAADEAHPAVNYLFHKAGEV